MALAIYSYVYVGASNNSFSDTAGRTISDGLYRFDEFAEAFLDAWQTANRRFTLSSSGFVTLDNNGGAAFSITWTDTALRDMLGFTANLAAQNSYTASRMVRCGYVSVLGSLADYDPVPYAAAEPGQTRSMGGVSRTTWMGSRVDEVEIVVFGLQNDARLTSPTGYFGVSYAGAAASELGLTEYAHCKDFLSDPTSASNHGFADGRPFVFFEDAADSDFTMDSAASPAWDALTSVEMQTWVAKKEACSRFMGEQIRRPKKHLYTMRIPACQYVAP